MKVVCGKLVYAAFAP
nr:hypothetical protein [Vibrio furnissii]